LLKSRQSFQRGWPGVSSLPRHDRQNPPSPQPPHRGSLSAMSNMPPPYPNIRGCGALPLLVFCALLAWTIAYWRWMAI
jgi:hypothetical protein